MDKYEYLTGEDSRYGPSALEKAKLKYSPLGKVFNKWLDEDNQKERLLKRLKNFEDKSKEQLKATKKKNENMKEVTDFVDEPLSLWAKELIEETEIIQTNVDYRKLKITSDNKTTYDLLKYLPLPCKKSWQWGEKITERFKNKVFPLNYDEAKKQEFRDKEEEITSDIKMVSLIIKTLIDSLI